MNQNQHDDVRVGEGTKVSLHFTLSLEDGTQVDSTRDKRAANFEYGDGNLPPGFEKPLVGMKAGETGTFTITPEHAFGQYNEQNVQVLKKESFDSQIELEPGAVVAFTDPNGGEIPGVIKSIEDERVDVDFNHPLAGKTLIFDVEILNVTPVTMH